MYIFETTGIRITIFPGTEPGTVTIYPYHHSIQIQEILIPKL